MEACLDQIADGIRSETMTNTCLSNSRLKRVLITNEADQLELESYSAAASSKNTIY